MNQFNQIVLTVALCLFAYVLRVYLAWKERVKSINNFPGYRNLVNPISKFHDLLPAIPFISAGPNLAWVNKYEDFKRWGRYAYMSIASYPYPISATIADVKAVKEIVANRQRYPKPLRESLFGKSILTTGGEEWKRHRKAAAPAFSEPNYKFVCSEAVDIMNGLFRDVLKGDKEIVFGDVKQLMTDITILVIGRTAFGSQITWSEDSAAPSGHKMPFKESLKVVSANLVTKHLLPAWSFSLLPKLRHIRDAFIDLPIYLQEMVDERKLKGNGEGRTDLLSLLIDASEKESNSSRLSDSEIIGNVFVYLFAGHETTSHTLSFSLALLALYSDQQEYIYQHIIAVLLDGRDPTYQDLNKLTNVLAVFYETLRMFPSEPEISKYATEDSEVTIGSPDGKQYLMSIPKGTRVCLSAVGLHYNPAYWDDPYEFRPQRFMEDWPRDAFLPFSQGPRACIGRRFAEIESIVILAMLIRRYKVEVQDEPKFAQETFEQRKERILRAKQSVTLTPIRIPLIFKKR